MEKTRSQRFPEKMILRSCCDEGKEWLAKQECRTGNDEGRSKCFLQWEQSRGTRDTAGPLDQKLIKALGLIDWMPCSLMDDTKLILRLP